MAKRRPRGRNVNGILLLDKNSGVSSNGALQMAKKMFAAAKAGHTGSLDPLATGMLPICFGEATKFSQFLLESDKSYRVTAKLGVITETGDADGEVVRTADVTASPAQIEDALMSFKGISSRCRACIRRSSMMACRSTSWPAKAKPWSAKRAR